MPFTITTQTLTPIPTCFGQRDDAPTVSKVAVVTLAEARTIARTALDGPVLPGVPEMRKAARELSEEGGLLEVNGTTITVEPRTYRGLAEELNEPQRHAALHAAMTNEQILGAWNAVHGTTQT